MKTVVLALTCTLLGTVLLADNKYFRVTVPLPPGVEDNLPADVPARDVLVQNGCFFFLYEGDVFPLTQAETPNQPICAG